MGHRKQLEISCVTLSSGTHLAHMHRSGISTVGIGVMESQMDEVMEVMNEVTGGIEYAVRVKVGG